ncbi:MAG: hypothetical protein CMP61_01860 [Flavobacteriales bacterium]|nr:hypothetical protein [Flavobacteriales bacterium]|tara:strand:- start:59689 stop:60243 length:555 start_codon:yes stop_codon:yes gene_type:complete
MKKIYTLLLLIVSLISVAQEQKKDPLIVNVEGVYGLGGIYDDALQSGGVGLGIGAWLPFKDGFIDLGLDITSSSSRNNGELQLLFVKPFSLMKDSTMELKGYAGVGVVIGRIFNNKDHFGPGVDDYNDGGLIGNLGLELKPINANYAFYLDAKTGIVSVPQWAQSITTPFKISLGYRFLLEYSK